MKARFTSTIILLLLFSASSFASVITSSDSSKKAYYAAKQEIENMLNGRSALSYEKAIYLIENAWYDGKLDKKKYITDISKQADIVFRIMASNWHPPTDTTDIFIPIQMKGKTYALALANWAIYAFMTDTLSFAGSGNHLPYQYSINDPMGSIDWRNTQVTNLESSGLGNCFALSSLFKILSDRLGSEAVLCTAPGHIYIAHADDKGTFYNVEIGSRDFPGTGTISTLTYSTTEAIKNDIALRELSDRQAIALCLVYLAKGYEHKFNTKTDAFMMGCAESTLSYDVKNLNAMLLKAEILETRIVEQRKTINQLQSNKEFIAYEKLLTQLHALGYREIPHDMKNLLIKRFTADSLQTLQAVAYTNEDKTRYASLSWGMFDEAHETSPVERYGNTILDIKAKKIKGFSKDQPIYNDYNFDPVVFALNVDPLTKKFPDMTPYAFAGNSPIQSIDADGLEPKGFMEHWTAKSEKVFIWKYGYTVQDFYDEATKRTWTVMNYPNTEQYYSWETKSPDGHPVFMPDNTNKNKGPDKEWTGVFRQFIPHHQSEVADGAVNVIAGALGATIVAPFAAGFMTATGGGSLTSAYLTQGSSTMGTAGIAGAKFAIGAVSNLAAQWTANGTEAPINYPQVAIAGATTALNMNGWTAAAIQNLVQFDPTDGKTVITPLNSNFSGTVFSANFVAGGIANSVVGAATNGLGPRPGLGLQLNGGGTGLQTIANYYGSTAANTAANAATATTPPEQAKPIK